MINEDATAPLTCLNGLFKPGFTSDHKIVIDVKGQRPTPGVYPFGEGPSIAMLNGRELQASEDDGRTDFHSRFFKKHGFVLLQHESKVQNWDSGAIGATAAIGDHSVKTQADANEIEEHYLPEVEDIIRNTLLPTKQIVIQQAPMLLRRGDGTANPFYGQVVHNDYGLTADDFEENVAAFAAEKDARGWRDLFEKDEVSGFMLINFWRTVHMENPLQHFPLGVLDASSVHRDDIISTGLEGFTMSGRITNQLSLRYNENQRWYYYPRMTTNEVLVLKLFECNKDDDGTAVYNSYHSAFEEPFPEGDIERRQSCEHRVSVFQLRNQPSQAE